MLIRRVDTPAPSPNLIGFGVNKEPGRYLNSLFLWICLRRIIYWRKINMSRCTVPPRSASRHVGDVGDK